MITSSLDEQHWQDRLLFIGKWLEYPLEDRPALWDAHRDLMDADLLEAAIRLPRDLTAAGRPEEAKQVEQLIDEIGGRIGLRAVDPAHAQDLLARDGFLADAIRTIYEGNADPARVRALLEANLKYLDAAMPNFLRAWIRGKLDALEGSATIAFATFVFQFGDLVAAFGGGERAANLEVAMHAYLAALEVLTPEEAPQFRAGALSRLAGIYNERAPGSRSDNLEAAIRTAHQALELCPGGTDPSARALAFDQLSLAYLERIVGQRADNLEAALAACRAWVEVSMGADDLVLAQSRLSVIYLWRHRGRRAENLEAALAAGQMALAHCPREADPDRYSTLQSNHSEVYIARINGDRADNLEQSVQAGRRALEGHTRESAPSRWAAAQAALGNAYNQRLRGDRAENLELAIAAYRAALEVYRRDTDPQRWALCQNNLSAAYLFRVDGNHSTNMEMALHASLAALEHYTRKDHPADWALVQNNLGAIYRERAGDTADNLEKAIAACRAAVEVYASQKDNVNWAMSQVNLGNAYQDRQQGEPAENLELAAGCYRAALAVCSREENPLEWAAAQQNLGSVYGVRARDGHPESVEASLAASRAALTVFRPDTHAWHCLIAASNLGACAYDAERWTDAWEGYHDAIEAAENMRARTANAPRQREILLGAMRVYANMVVTCVQLGRHAEALEYAERSKARGLAELLAARDLYPKGDVPAEILGRLNHLRSALAAEDEPRAVVPDRPPSSGNVGERGGATLLATCGPLPTDPALSRAIRAELNQLILREVQPIDPSFPLTQGPQPIGFDAIRALLEDDDSAILQWHITVDRFFAFVVTRQDTAPRVWSSSTADLNALHAWTDEYLRGYHAGDHARWRRELEGWLARLAAILHLDEVLALLPPGCRQLTVVPHRFLHLFPMHALPVDGGAGLLLERFLDGVRYAPSCQLLWLAGLRPPAGFDRLLVVGDPNDDLTYAHVEVDSVLRGFASACVLFGRDATKRAFTEAASLASGQAHCVHLSCHGQFEPSAPLNSFLLLAGCVVSPPTAQPDPGRYRLTGKDQAVDLHAALTLQDLFGRQFDLRQCQLATLSACETGLCEFNALDDEYIGLPSGFLFAGAASVVSSLWAVNDFSTALLLTRFYENLHRRRECDPAGRLQTAAALSEAQSWLRSLSQADVLAWSKDRLDDAHQIHLHHLLASIGTDTPFSDPYHWAAFCATGL